MKMTRNTKVAYNYLQKNWERRVTFICWDIELGNRPNAYLLTRAAGDFHSLM